MDTDIIFIEIDVFDSLRTDGYEPFFVPFTYDFDKLHIEEHIRYFQVHQFAYA